jgi:hypothetical protein
LPALWFCEKLACMSRTIGGFGIRGSAALIIAVIAVAGLAIYARSFVFIMIAAAVAAVVILHFWNKRPVKPPEDDQIRLHLNDDK